MKKLFLFVFALALSTASFAQGQDFYKMANKRYYYEVAQKYDTLFLKYIHLEIDSLPVAGVDDTLIAVVSPSGQIKLVNKSAIGIGGSTSDIVQYGGNFGKFYNTNDSFPLAGIGAPRGIGYAKLFPSGTLLNAIVDLSGITSNPDDSTDFLLGFLNTTDFSGTRIEIHKNELLLTADSNLLLTAPVLDLDANEYTIENLVNDTLDYIIGTKTDGKTLQKYPVSQLITENIPAAEFGRTNTVVHSLLTGGETNWLIGDSTWGAGAGYVVSFDRVNSIFSAGSQNAYSTAGYGSVLLGVNNSVGYSQGFVMGSSSSAGYLGVSLGYNNHSPSIGMVSIGSTNDTTIFPSLTDTAWVPADPIFTVGNGFGSVSNALVMLKNGRTALGNFVPLQRLHVGGQIIIDTLLSGNESDSIVIVDAAGLLKKVNQNNFAKKSYVDSLSVSTADSAVFRDNSGVVSNIYPATQDFVFGSSALGSSGGSGGFNRFLFDKSKGAFRAGRSTNTFWNDDSLGNYSSAFGFNVKAKGASSFAVGNSSIATDDYATATGDATSALGEASFATGANTKAQSIAEMVFGYRNSVYTPLGGTNSWDNSDRLFVIGNGWSVANDALRMLKSGNMALGNFNPTEKLDVDGSIRLRTVIAGSASDSIATISSTGVLKKVNQNNFAKKSYVDSISNVVNKSLSPIYVTHGTSFTDSSYYAFGVATPNKVVDSIFFLNLNESFSNIAIQNSRQLKYISARNLRYVLGAYNINGNATLTKAYSPNLEFAISVAANALPMVDSLDFNRLKYLGSDFVASANITMTYLGLDSFIALGGNFNIQGDSMITSLNLGSVLDYGGTVTTTGCKSMTSLTLNPALKCGGTPTFTLNGCAFTQASVDNILGALVSSGVTNGTVNLSGGTSSTPSATGLAFKATLVSNGWTVTHN